MRMRPHGQSFSSLLVWGCWKPVSRRPSNSRVSAPFASICFRALQCSWTQSYVKRVYSAFHVPHTHTHTLLEVHASWHWISMFQIWASQNVHLQAYIVTYRCKCTPASMICSFYMCFQVHLCHILSFYVYMRHWVQYVNMILVNKKRPSCLQHY